MKKILLIAPPILKDEKDATSFLLVPPVGYGGVENVMYAITNGLIHYGLKVTLVGVPGSRVFEGVEIIRDVRTADEIRTWVVRHQSEFDVIHDHSCGLVFNSAHGISSDIAYLATHHQTGVSPYPRNTVYLSNAQRAQAGDLNSPVVRLPVMLGDYIFREEKENFYLCLGRISEWKGVLQASRLCRKLGARLVIAGPAWEKDYFEMIRSEAGKDFEYIGEVSGLKRLDIISKAKAVIVLSRPTASPWGGSWCEPGATIVSEAAASGTPIIASNNGCLAEIVTSDVGIRLSESEIENIDTMRLEGPLPTPVTVRGYAEAEWDYRIITATYIKLYEKLKEGSR